MRTTSFAQLEYELRHSFWAIEHFGLDVRSNRTSGGAELYDELASRGLVRDWRELAEIDAGQSLTIGMTRYVRLA